MTVMYLLSSDLSELAKLIITPIRPYDHTYPRSPPPPPSAHLPQSDLSLWQTSSLCREQNHLPADTGSGHPLADRVPRRQESRP